MSANLVKSVAKDCQLDDTFLQSTTAEITELYNEVVSLGRQLASTVYKIGGLLMSSTINMTRETFSDWIASLPFSENTAKNYMALYVFFNAREHELEDLTIMQAYAIAGISGRKELSAPPTTVDAELIEGEEIHIAGQADQEAKERKKRARKLFKLPPLSGIELKNYRLNFEDGNFMLWEKSGRSTFVCELSLPNVEPESADVLKRNVQIELEKYFAILDESGWIF